MHLFDRIQWAFDNLQPVQSEYCIIYEDSLDEPAKICLPAPEWLAMALHGNLLPPVEAYHQVEYGCWNETKSSHKLWSKLRYTIVGLEILKKRLDEGEDKEILQEEFDKRVALFEELREKITEKDEPQMIFKGPDGERLAQKWCEDNNGFYRIINYDVVHCAKPVGPMTEEEALQYILLKDVPSSVWSNVDGSNRRKYVFTKRKNIPKEDVFRNAWQLGV